jgi:hypothetical protein
VGDVGEEARCPRGRLHDRARDPGGEPTGGGLPHADEEDGLSPLFELGHELPQKSRLAAARAPEEQHPAVRGLDAAPEIGEFGTLVVRERCLHAASR